MNANGGLSPEGWGYLTIGLLVIVVWQVTVLTADMMMENRDKPLIDFTKVFNKKKLMEWRKGQSSSLEHYYCIFPDNHDGLCVEPPREDK